MMFDNSPDSEAPPPALSVRGLTKRFGDRTVVDDVSFDVPFGAVTGFVGANGSGKTTTMRMLLGLTLPTSGHALVRGAPFAELREPRRLVGAAVDRLGGHPGHGGRLHLRLIATGSGFDEGRVEEVLALVGLEEAADRRIATYSTGMKQRLALGAALLGDPRILVLDEPSNGLDPAGVRWMRYLLRESAANGAAVFVSTHQLAELSSIVDRLVVLDSGRVAASGSVTELTGRTGVDTVEQVVFALTDPRTEVPS